MSYVLIGILALLVIGGGITYMVMSATRKSSPASPDSSDPTPVGDTPEHAQVSETAPGATDSDHEGDGRFKRDPIGGEAEAAPAVESGDASRPGA